MKTRRGILFVFCIFLPFSLFAQEYGDISDEEFQINSVPDDPEADLIILFDKATLKITPDWDLVLDRHVRIKILTEAGKENANIKIPFWHEDKITTLEAASYLVNGDDFELDEDDIFEERNNNIKIKIFAIPGVEAGSIIEYEYTLFSKYISRLKPWFFQSDEYTKLSEITVFIPQGFMYSVIKKNTLFLDIEEKNDVVFDPYRSPKKCRRFTWRVKNIPGIKNEPYMTAKTDYYAQILFQLAGFKDRYNQLSFAKTWDDIAESIWNIFEKFITRDRGMTKLADELTVNAASDQEKMKNLFDFVQLKIKTNNSIYIFSDDLKEPKQIIEDKNASSNAKNLLLINLLQKAGLETYPLLISTRSNGRLDIDWKQAQQFNRIITYVKVGTKKWFLNPGSQQCPMGVLNPAYHVKNGLLIKESKGQIITLKPKKSRNKTIVITDAQIQEDGSIYCKSDLEYCGIDAVKQRSKLEDNKVSEYVKNSITNLYSTAEIDTFFYSDIDSIDKSLKLYIEYHIPNYLEEAGSLVIFEAPLLMRATKNRFVRETRNFPVDFDYATTKTEKINISYPASLKLNEKPSKTAAIMNKFKFIKIYFNSDNTIEIQRNYILGRTRFKRKEYKKLKYIFEKIVNSDQDKIVMDRIN